MDWIEQALTSHSTHNLMTDKLGMTSELLTNQLLLGELHALN